MYSISITIDSCGKKKVTAIERKYSGLLNRIITDNHFYSDIYMIQLNPPQLHVKNFTLPKYCLDITVL